MALRYALLGVLSTREMSGYDIKRYFDRAVHFVWNASDSQTYRELRGMERDGLITSRLVHQEAKPNKRLYRMTDAGRAELDAWLISPLETPYRKDPFLLRLFFMARVSPVAAQQILEARHEELRALIAVGEERLETYGDLSKSSRPERLWWQVRLINGMRRMHMAEDEWICELLSELRSSPEEPIDGLLEDGAAI